MNNSQFFQNVLQVHSLENGELIKTFPTEFGTIRGYSGKRKFKDIFYQFSSFLTPSIFYRCDLSQPEMKPEVMLNPLFDLSHF